MKTKATSHEGSKALTVVHKNSILKVETVEADKYKHFFYNNLDLACFANLDGYFEELNKNFTKVLGYTTKDLLDKKFLEFIHPDDIEATLAVMKKISFGFNAISFTNRYRTKWNTYRYLEWSSVVNLETKKIYAIGRDITEKMVSVKELIFQNEEKEKRADELNIINKQLIFQNKEKEKRAAELIIANKELAFENEEKEKRAAELIVANKELAFENEEKEKRAAELIITNAELKKAKSDIQKLNEQLEQKVIERTAELQKSVKEISDYKFALDKSSIVAITNSTGIISYVNDNFCRISKYNREELIGKSHRVINSGFHSKEFIHDLWKTITQGNVWTGELKNKAKDGTYYWVDTIIVPFLNEKGIPFQYVAIRSDITHKKKAEEQLQIANTELESFSHAVSHDLKAPIRAISGYAKILEEDYPEKFDKEGMSALYSIMYNSKRMAELIDDLLAFSNLGKKEVAVSDINMQALVKSVKDIVVVADNKNRTEINITELPPTRGNQELIKQVWVNLISNAIKYSQYKPKTIIEIGAYDEGNFIVYYVKDNGAGFDMQYYDKLFGMFQRLHAKEEFEGTGIGLAIVQKIIHRHNGTVWAESTLNEGTCLYFRLPAINLKSINYE